MASADTYSVSVSDDGPRSPSEFTRFGSSGLGMKIIQSLVKQIGGKFHSGQLRTVGVHVLLSRSAAQDSKRP